MATDPGFAAFVVEQEGSGATSGDVRVRRMFGEYALYLGDKLVGLLCDDQAFLKSTAGGRALLAALLQRTAAELPEPKPKKAKAKAKRARR